MNDEVDALQPATSLFDKVRERVRRLFAHLAFDPIERVAACDRSRREVRVFGYAAVYAIVKRDLRLDRRFTHDKWAYF